MDPFPTEVRTLDEVSEALRVLKTSLEKILRRSGSVLIDDADDGLYLKDDNGVYWLVQVDTSGNLTTDNSAGTTRPG